MMGTIQSSMYVQYFTSDSCQLVCSQAASKLASSIAGAKEALCVANVREYFTLEMPQSKTAMCNVCKARLNVHTILVIKHLKEQHMNKCEAVHP